MTRFSSTGRRRPLVAGLATAPVVLILDQISKYWVLEHVMVPPRVIEVTSFFNLVMGWNRGVTFGLFNTDSPLNAWILPFLAAVICGLLIVWMARTPRLIVGVCLGLVVGGAVGNVIDRLRFGAVFDFLDVHVAGYHWPAFNVADSAITIGVILMIIDSFVGGDERKAMPVAAGQKERNP